MGCFGLRFGSETGFRTAFAVLRGPKWGKRRRRALFQRLQISIRHRNGVIIATFLRRTDLPRPLRFTQSHPFPHIPYSSYVFFSCFFLELLPRRPSTDPAAATHMPRPYPPFHNPPYICHTGCASDLCSAVVVRLVA